jgi:uncharacterized phage-associated protein
MIKCTSLKQSSGMLMSIQFKFHPKKAVEAAAVILKLHGKPIKYLGLLKMLYISDRIALQQMEQPITGDHYVSMNYGPVLSSVYDLIKGKPVDADNALALWSRFISSLSGKQVRLLEDPGNEELCEEEEEIIQSVYKTFGHLDPFLVAEWTHDGSSIPILVEDVLKYVGKNTEEINEIGQEAIREAYLDGVLNG